MRQRPRDHERRGAVLVETALVLLVFLLLILGMLDLGIAVLRNHLVAEAARQGARQAIVHGSKATQLGTWTAGNYQAPLRQFVLPLLPGIDPDTVAVQADWPDGGNDPGQRVRVTVSTSYRPIITLLFGSPSFNLSATSVMPIAH
jgi:Flp pilus assembly protein TadG